MAKQELYNRIADLMCAENRDDPAACKANALKALQCVDEWVAGVIGPKDIPYIETDYDDRQYCSVCDTMLEEDSQCECDIRNKLITEQLKRAGIAANQKKGAE